MIEETHEKEYVLQSTITALVNAQLSIEKVRVRSQVRKTHLALQGKSDIETDKLVDKLLEIEDYLDGRVAGIIINHPAYPWFSKVKGVGKENIGKVVATIDIKKADTISSLWKYGGFDVVNGKAPKREKGGGKLTYNSQLRSMCWRLGSSLMRAKGKFYDYYESQKRMYVESYNNHGIKIVPTNQLPKKDNKHYEPKEMITEGHLHNRALRKMIKLFLACLWIEWRKAEGLEVTKPYAIDKLGHDHYISPAEMTDRATVAYKSKTGI
jgi:hypothetical protein